MRSNRKVTSVEERGREERLEEAKRWFAKLVQEIKPDVHCDVRYTQEGVNPLSGFVGTFWEGRNKGRVGFKVGDFEHDCPFVKKSSHRS